MNPAIELDGLLHGGGATQLGRQAVAAAAVFGYSFVATLALGYLVRFTIGFRVRPEVEDGGLDLHQHAESAYDQDGGSFTAGDPDRHGAAPPEELSAAQARAIERHLERVMQRRSNTRRSVEVPDGGWARTPGRPGPVPRSE